MAGRRCRRLQARVVCQSKSGQRRRVVGSYDAGSRHVLLEPGGDWLTLAEFAYKVTTPARLIAAHACKIMDCEACWVHLHAAMGER
jgi:hypothetical protein